VDGGAQPGRCLSFLDSGATEEEEEEEKEEEQHFMYSTSLTPQ
jgi:hypothetical protein